MKCSIQLSSKIIWFSVLSVLFRIFLVNDWNHPATCQSFLFFFGNDWRFQNLSLHDEWHIARSTTSIARKKHLSYCGWRLIMPTNFVHLNLQFEFYIAVTTGAHHNVNRHRQSVIGKLFLNVSAFHCSILLTELIEFHNFPILFRASFLIRLNVSAITSYEPYEPADYRHRWFTAITLMNVSSSLLMDICGSGIHYFQTNLEEYFICTAEKSFHSRITMLM